ncbi:MAG: hypothetical protein ACRBBW_07290 [Cellvibrionaceae bacterium]
MQTPECSPKVKSSDAFFADVDQPPSAASQQNLTLTPSLIEKRLFGVLCLVTLCIIVTHPQLVSAGDDWGLELRLVLWLALTLYGVRQLREQSILTLMCSPLGQYSDLGGGRYELELGWSLMPWLMLIKYRSGTKRWHYRMIWPDSGDEESLRLLRVSTASMG